MAASDHVNPHQLAMLIPARQLYGMPSLDTAAFKGDVEAMRGAKRRVNSMSRLSDVSGGINKPVQIHHGDDHEIKKFRGGAEGPVVANGNHRVVAAYDANPDMEVPVEHYDSANKLFVAMRRQDESW